MIFTPFSYQQLRHYLLFIYLILNFFLFKFSVFWSSIDKERRLVILSILTTSIVVCFPFFKYDLVLGHNISFHLMRIASIADGLKCMQFPVRLESLWVNNYGYATGMCYGGILLYIPAILYIIGFPLSEAYKIFIFIITLATATISYKCFARISKNSAQCDLFRLLFSLLLSF